MQFSTIFDILKKMRNIFILLLITFCSFGLSAQTMDDEESKSVSDQFFLGIASSYYVDFATTPLGVSYEPTGNTIPKVDPNDSNNTIYVDEYANVPSQTTYISYFSFGIEPRFNVKEISENLAFAVSAPVTIGFGQAFPSNDDVKGSQGFGSIQIPVLAKLYLGSGSTYESNEDFGISIGAGLEMNKIALINPGATLEEQQLNKAWIMPAVTGGVHFWRGSSPMEVNVKYGFGKLQSYRRNKYNQIITSGERFTKASSIKLTFIYLMNY
jgi:hypothetical protein